MAAGVEPFDIRQHASHGVCGDCHDHSLFEANNKAEFTCAICNDICRFIVETPCGHTFGHCCLLRWMEREAVPQVECTDLNDAADAPKNCPVCRQPILLGDCRLAVRDARKIGDLRVRCPVQDCRAQMELRALPQHQATLCPERKVECDACHVSFSFREKVTHDATGCTRRLVPCPICAERVPFETLELHVHSTDNMATHLRSLLTENQSLRTELSATRTAVSALSDELKELTTFSATRTAVSALSDELKELTTYRPLLTFLDGRYCTFCCTVLLPTWDNMYGPEKPPRPYCFKPHEHVFVPGDKLPCTGDDWQSRCQNCWKSTCEKCRCCGKSRLTLQSPPCPRADFHFMEPFDEGAGKCVKCQVRMPRGGCRCQNFRNFCASCPKPLDPSSKCTVVGHPFIDNVCQICHILDIGVNMPQCIFHSCVKE